MKKSEFFYVPPMLQVVEVSVESGYAGSSSGPNPGTGSGTESWQPGDSI